MKLNDVACRNATLKDRPYKKADGYRLYLLINPNGSKLWRWKYRFRGKEKTLALGDYHTLSLRNARKMRDDARELLSQDIDPSQVKQEEKRKKKLNAEHTFEAIAREWHKVNFSKWTASSAAVRE